MKEITKGDISFKLEFQEKLRGGYYSPAHIVDIEHQENGLWVPKTAVMKQWGKSPDIKDDCGSFETLEEIEIVMRDVDWLRGILKSSGVKIPEIYFREIVDEKLSWLNAILSLADENKDLPTSGYRVISLEEFSGIVLQDLTGEDKKTAIETAKKALSLIPDGIAIDAHPGNFTWDGKDVTFVDFVPPKIWEYRGLGRMEEIFPTIRKREDDEKKKHYYLTSRGRIERYNYYVSKFR